MIIQVNVFICDNPGCGRVSSTTKEVELYDNCVERPEGEDWGLLDDNHYGCPTCMAAKRKEEEQRC